MPAMSRREFIKHSAAQAAVMGLISASAFELSANPLGLPIGCQTWPVRKMIAQDFAGTLKELREAGFQNIEMCSPVGYADSGFGGLAQYKGSELRKIINDAGLACESSHFGIQELRKNQDERISWAKDLGLKQMLVPSLGGPKNPTMDDVNRAAEEYNKMGEKAAAAGIRQGLHNENFETSSVDGKRTYDILIGLLDARFVNFQFQISTISEGFDAAEYFHKYPGRFFSMHVQGWSADTKKIAAVGQDTLDWKNIFTAAQTGGLKNYFVEMSLDLMQASAPYLRSLQV